MSVQATLSGSLTISTGVPGSTNSVQPFAALSAALSAIAQAPQGSVGTSPTSQTLPASPTNVVLIQNTHATQTLTVTWTPNGGASNPVITLEPGSLIAIVEAAGSAGITALSLTGSGSGTTFIMVLGG